MRNYWETLAELKRIGSTWGKKDKKGRYFFFGRFPTDGYWMSPGGREIRKCDFCDNTSICTVKLTNPYELHWLCEEHEILLISQLEWEK